MAFIQKSINSSGRIGQDLIEWRERAGLSLSQAAAATKINQSLIQVWEEERWSEIDDAVYTERMLRAYVAFLGGSVPYMVQKYHEGMDAERLTRKPEDLLPRVRKLRLTDFLVGHKLVAFAGFCLLAIALIGYVFFQAHRISQAPSLVITSPINGARLEVPSAVISGKTDADVTVDVNGRQVFVEADGSFQFNLDIPRGTTLVRITARKRHGREASEVRRVVYDQPLPEWNMLPTPVVTTSTSATSTNNSPINRQNIE